MAGLGIFGPQYPEEVSNLSPRLVFQRYPFPKMPPFHRLSHLATATLLGLVAACPAIDLESLTKNSPFGGTARPATPDAAPSTLEFRGMYVDGGLAYYSIYNSLTKQSSWVAEGEAPSANVPVTVKGFEVATETLTIDNEGHPQKMELHQAVVATFRPGSIPVAAPHGASRSGRRGNHPRRLQFPKSYPRTSGCIP